MDPSAVGSDWASYAAIYDEFRVVGIKITLVPSQQGSVTAINAPVIIVYDNDDSNVLTSYNAALEYDTHKVLSSIWYQRSGSAYSSMWLRPTSGNNTAILWSDVGTPVATGSVKFYATGLTASTTYFGITVEHYVEFRGRR